MTERPDLPLAAAQTPDRDIAEVVAPLGEVLQLSRDAASAMRGELERLEARFCEIREEADSICALAAGGERSEWVDALCRQAASAEQRLRDCIGEVTEQVDQLELRGARLVRTCDQVEQRHAELTESQTRHQSEVERLTEMPLARIEAAADAAAARLEALIEQASEASARAASAAGQHAQLESALGDAAAELAPWAPLVSGSAPGPVADLLNLARTEVRQEVASLGDGLTKLAEAVVLLAQARPPRRARAASKPPARKPAARTKSQIVEAKPARAGASARAATSIKSVARGGARKVSRRAGASATAPKQARRSSARGATTGKSTRRAPAGGRRAAARKTASSRRR
ncbi:MAG: hypothetical protein ACF8R7_08705 [Phycisphaerales bacterium JB039]